MFGCKRIEELNDWNWILRGLLNGDVRVWDL